MVRFIAILAFLTLAACGADGEPETPPPPPGLQVTVEYGISGSF